jgi:hypothetical protein
MDRHKRDAMCKMPWGGACLLGIALGLLCYTTVVYELEMVEVRGGIASVGSINYFRRQYFGN